MMYTILQTKEFAGWLTKLRDAKGRARILARIKSAELGNLGDIKPVGDGVSEMRVHFGPGNRVYFKKRGKVIIILLLGGDKSTQAHDINKAKNLAEKLKEKL